MNRPLRDGEDFLVHLLQRCKVGGFHLSKDHSRGRKGHVAQRGVAGGSCSRERVARQDVAVTGASHWGRGECCGHLQDFCSVLRVAPATGKNKRMQHAAIGKKMRIKHRGDREKHAFVLPVHRTGNTKGPRGADAAYEHTMTWSCDYQLSPDMTPFL